jgi:vacuolar protein sorting-associated protein 26
MQYSLFCYALVNVSLFILTLFPELYYDRGNHHEFTSLVKELARPGDMTQNASYEFDFAQVEKPYESYTGANVRLR